MCDPPHDEPGQFWPYSLEQRLLLPFLGFLLNLENTKKTNEAKPTHLTETFLRTPLLSSLCCYSGDALKDLISKSDLRVT